jgi:hypothetical protein
VAHDVLVLAMWAGDRPLSRTVCVGDPIIRNEVFREAYKWSGAASTLAGKMKPGPSCVGEEAGRHKESASSILRARPPCSISKHANLYLERSLQVASACFFPLSSSASPPGDERCPLKRATLSSKGGCVEKRVARWPPLRGFTINIWAV